MLRKQARVLRADYKKHAAAGNHAAAAGLAHQLHLHHSELMHDDVDTSDYHDRQQRIWWNKHKEHERKVEVS